MEGASSAEDSANVWRRFMSATYEAVMLFAVVFFFGYGFSALTSLKFNGQYSPLLIAFQVWMALVLGVYFSWFWSNGRRTLPMKTMGVKLVGPDGGPVGTARAAVRYFAAGMMYAISFALIAYVHKGFAITLLIPFFWSLLDKQSRALYDVIAGTRLILADPR